jgi:hypothetical protein
VRAAVAGRVLLVLAGVVAVAWLALGLRATDLQEDGVKEGAAAGRHPAGPRLEHALDLLRRAGERNPDPRPQLDEAALLLAAGRNRAAAGLLEGVVDRNPGNIRGWGLLASATAPFDEHRSLEANGELLKLYGRIPGELAAGVVRSTSGALYRVTPGHAKGVVDRVRRAGDDMVFRGWAGLPAQRRPVQEVLIVAHGRVVAAATPDVARPDVAAANGGSGTGFRKVVPISALRGKDGQLDAHVLGAGNGAASLLGVDCRRPQALGC